MTNKTTDSANRVAKAGAWTTAKEKASTATSNFNKHNSTQGLMLGQSSSAINRSLTRPVPRRTLLADDKVVSFHEMRSKVRSTLAHKFKAKRESMR